MKKLLGVGMLVALAVVGLSVPGTSFHGAWWKANGTVGINGQNFPVVADWSGRQFGDTGVLKLTITFPGTGLPAHTNSVQVTERWGNVFFIGCVEFAEPYSHTSVAPLLLKLNGVMRNDLCTGLNNNDFTGTYLGVLPLVLKSTGGFGIAHG